MSFSATSQTGNDAAAAQDHALDFLGVMREAEYAAWRDEFGDDAGGDGKAALSQAEQDEGLGFGGGAHQVAEVVRASAAPEECGSAWQQRRIQQQEFVGREKAFGLDDGDDGLIEGGEAAVPEALFVAEGLGERLKARHGGHFFDAVDEQRGAGAP